MTTFRTDSPTTVFRHALAALVAFGLALAAAPATALALPGESSSSGPGATFGGSGGGGPSSVAINDFVGLDERTFSFSAGIHRRFEGACDPSPAAGVCQLGSFETAPATVKVNGGNRGKESGTDPQDFNSAAFGQIGILNKCKITTPVQGNLSTASGCYFTNSAPRWFEVHPVAPDSTQVAVQGGTSIAMVRVWRSCRPDRNQSGAATAYRSGATCKTEPIFERTVNGADSSQAAAESYFDRGSNRDAFRARSQPLAGPLYGACSQSDCSFEGEYISGGYTRMMRKAPAQRSIQSMCANGPLEGETSATWNNTELAREFAYRAERGRAPYAGRAEQLQEWAAASPAERSPLPPGFVPDGSKSNTSNGLWKLCQDLSERISAHWSLGARSGNGGAKVTLIANLIPGRVYVAQVVFADARENILQQSVTMLASASSSCETACEPTDPVKIDSSPTDGDLSAPPVAASFVGTDTTTPIISAAQFLTDPTYCPRRTSDPNRSSLCPRTVDTDWDDTRTVNPANYSIWLPRALTFGLYNSQDRAASSYASTHKVTASGASNAQAAFAMNGVPSNGVVQQPDRSGTFPVRFGTTDEDNQTKAGLGGASIWGGFLPLYGDGVGGFRTDVRVAAQKTTWSPKRGTSTGVGGSTFDPSEAELTRASDNRFLTLVGENRYQSGKWTVGEGSATKYLDQRWTMDYCPAGSAITPWLDTGTKNTPRPQRFCDANYSLGGGLKVSDAYYVPASDGSRTTVVSALFTQEKTGKARLSLYSNQLVDGEIQRVDVFDAKDYRQAADTSVGDYYAVGTKTIRFDCDYDNPTCWTQGATAVGDTPSESLDASDELPAGEYVVRFKILTPKPFYWGIGGSTYTNTEQRWYSRFDVIKRQMHVGVFRARNAG